jgi:hypothetical protein
MARRAFAAAASIACGIAALVITLSCSETRRGPGEDCLKDDDCLSGICSQQHCAAAPPLLDGEPPVPAEGGPDSAGDAALDAPVAPPEAGPDVRDSGTSGDGGSG